MSEHIIPGRAYTPEQKRTIIEKLYKIWLDVPTLRLGQLMYIVGGSSFDHPTFFYIEDEALITELEKHIIPPTTEQISRVQTPEDRQPTETPISFEQFSLCGIPAIRFRCIGCENKSIEVLYHISSNDTYIYRHRDCNKHYRVIWEHDEIGTSVVCLEDQA